MHGVRVCSHVGVQLHLRAAAAAGVSSWGTVPQCHLHPIGLTSRATAAQCINSLRSCPGIDGAETCMHRAEKHESLCRSSRDPVKLRGGGEGGVSFGVFSAFVMHEEDGNRAPGAAGVTFPPLRSISA